MERQHSSKVSYVGSTPIRRAKVYGVSSVVVARLSVKQ